MTDKTYSQASEAALLTLLGALAQDEWGEVREPDAPSLTHPMTLNAVALCKHNLLRTLTAMRRTLHPNPEDAPALFDQDWDRVQRLWASTITRLELSADPQARADASLLRSATLKGRGTAQTAMRYVDEVQWGFAQTQKAEEPTIRAAIDRNGLQDHIAQIDEATSALAEAIGWNTQGQRLRPSHQRRVALRRCAEACDLADQTLSVILDIAPVGSPDADTVASLLRTLRQCLK